MITPDLSRLAIALERSISEGIPLNTEAGRQNTLNAMSGLSRWINATTHLDSLGDHIKSGQLLAEEGNKLLQESSTSVASLPSQENWSTPLDPDGKFEESESSRFQLSKVLQQIVEELNEVPRTSTIDNLISRINRWEADYLSNLWAPVKTEEDNEKPIRLDADTLQKYFRTHVPGAEDIVVTSANRLSGGYGRATTLIQFDQPIFGQRELVMRAQLPDSVIVFEGVDINAEFQAFSLGCAAGIPAPRPVHIETDENETGTKFILMERLTGSNYGSVFSVEKELSDDLVYDIVKVLADIHSIDLNAHSEIVSACHLADWAKDKTRQDSVKRWLDMWYDFWIDFDFPSPLITRGFKWLYENIPDSDLPPAVLHSDYALGNLLIEGDRVSGVLDWEQTHLGDPAEEVLWITTNLRQVVPEETVIDIYGRITGDYISTSRLRFFDVFTAVKIMLCGVSAAHKFQAKQAVDGLFCELASFTMAPYARLIHETIERAEKLKLN